MKPKNVHVADFAVSLPILFHFSCSIYRYSFEEIMFVFTFYRNVIYAFCNNDACVNKVNILVYGAWTALEFPGHWQQFMILIFSQYDCCFYFERKNMTIILAKLKLFYYQQGVKFFWVQTFIWHRHRWRRISLLIT